MLTELAFYSDRLFMAAVGVYVLAMVLHGAEYAGRGARRPACWSGAGGPAADGVGRPAWRRRGRFRGRSATGSGGWPSR